MRPVERRIVSYDVSPFYILHHTKKVKVLAGGENTDYDY